MRHCILVIAIALAPISVWSQDQGTSESDDGEDLKIIQIELDKSAPRQEPTLPVEEEKAPAMTDQRPINFSDLGQLSPFTEISVIQRRYLPKTGRVQFFGGLTLITNDPFFNTVGFVAKAGYFFTEGIGLEANYFGLSTAEAKATKELRGIQGVLTDSLIETKGATALDLVLVPIYGKMTWFNDRIIPFDLYFSLGYGVTKTQSENAGTVHLATGQVFALSKASAFRWDFSWNFFNATGVNGKVAAYNNLFLTAGLSWFIPEAKYR